jgi:hypothetical protein
MDNCGMQTKIKNKRAPEQISTGAMVVVAGGRMNRGRGQGKVSKRVKKKNWGRKGSRER